jgi:hypothetical protein
MGVCTQGDIQIELQSIKDADYVYSQIEKIEELTVARTGESAHFGLDDNHVQDETFNCNVYADRAQNGEFQIEQVIAQLRIMVAEGKIEPPVSFEGELQTQYAAWSLDEDDFEENRPEE